MKKLITVLGLSLSLVSMKGLGQDNKPLSKDGQIEKYIHKNKQVYEDLPNFIKANTEGGYGEYVMEDYPVKEDFYFLKVDGNNSTTIVRNLKAKDKFTVIYHDRDGDAMYNRLDKYGNRALFQGERAFTDFSSEEQLEILKAYTEEAKKIMKKGEYKNY